MLTFDPLHPPFWLVADYCPAFLELDLAVMPPISALAAELGPCTVRSLPVPHDCIDGFLGAYWRRPEVYLEAEARAAISAFAKADVGEGIARLGADLASGAWERRHGALRSLDAYDIGYRIVSWNFG